MNDNSELLSIIFITRSLHKVNKMAVQTLYGCSIHPVNLDESFYACVKCKFLCMFNFGC